MVMHVESYSHILSYSYLPLQDKNALIRIRGRIQLKLASVKFCFIKIAKSDVCKNNLIKRIILSIGIAHELLTLVLQHL